MTFKNYWNVIDDNRFKLWIVYVVCTYIKRNKMYRLNKYGPCTFSGHRYVRTILDAVKERWWYVLKKTTVGRCRLLGPIVEWPERSQVIAYAHGFDQRNVLARCRLQPQNLPHFTPLTSPGKTHRRTIDKKGLTAIIYLMWFFVGLIK